MTKATLRETFVWIGTATMLGSYLCLSVGILQFGMAFLACQLVGQIGLTWVSILKKAWQPASVNIAFGIVSVVGLLRLGLP